MRLRDRVRDRDVERAAAAAAAGRHRLLIGEDLARAVEDRDPERGLEDVGRAGHVSRVADRRVPRRAVDPDRRQKVDEVRPAEGLRRRYALDLDGDRLDRRELGQGVDDLAGPGLDRRRVTAGLELARESTWPRHLDRQADQRRAAGRGADRAGPVARGGAGEERLHRGGRDGLRAGHLAERRDEAALPGGRRARSRSGRSSSCPAQWTGWTVAGVEGSSDGSSVGASDDAGLSSADGSGVAWGCPGRPTDRAMRRPRARSRAGRYRRCTRRRRRQSPAARRGRARDGEQSSGIASAAVHRS